MRKIYLYFVCLFVLLSVSCAVNPVTGERELSLYSEQDEIALGKNTDGQIKAIYGVYNDPDLNTYVMNVGQSLVPHTHRPHLEYHFAVLDSPVVNAFAVPGGYVYVTRGILALMNSEAELAVVLGHELGHVNARHSIHRMSEQMLFQVGLAVGSALNQTFANIAGLASTGVQLLFLKYSRDDERQADQLGVEYSRKGKYNPGEMIPFFHSLEELGDLSGGRQSLPGFLSTHPLTSERIQNTKDMLLETDNNLSIDRNPYLQRLDGTVFGEDPRQGFVEGNAFYQPEMRFFFKFPNQWNLQNTPSQVTIASKDGNAGVILQAEQSSDSPRVYGQKTIAQVKEAHLGQSKDLKINGFQAYQQLLDLPQQNSETIRLLATFIKDGSFIYTFVALSTIANFDAFSPDFNRLVGSFQRLTNRSFLNRQPVRIRLVKADGRRTLQEILQRERMEKELWSRFAVFNNLELDQIPSKNKLIKIIK
ncbi:M48 family metalloprotease [Acidobacteriota bacterium]